MGKVRPCFDRGKKGFLFQVPPASSLRIGGLLMRLPVSAKIALQTAAAVGGNPGSPMPVNRRR